MAEINMHPNCIKCFNCEKIKYKYNSHLVQDEDGSSLMLCNDCYESLLEEEEEDFQE